MASDTATAHRVLFGAQFGIALLFLAQGSRRVSATRTALFSILDTPVGPLWMWLGFGELPSTACFIGGSIVMTAVLADIFLPRGRRMLTQPG